MSHLPTLGDVSGPVPLPASVLGHLGIATAGPGTSDGSELLSKGWWVSFADSGLVAFLYRGPRLEVVSIRSNERLAAWTFGASGNARHSSRRDSPEIGQTNEITCCAEIFGFGGGCGGGGGAGNVDNNSSNEQQMQQQLTQQRLLAVGLSSGLVCLFCVRSSRVVRAVQMPHRVTSLAVVDGGASWWSSGCYGSSGGAAGVGGGGGSCGPRSGQGGINHLAEELMFFQGIVAVGTQEGHVYLLDAGLDENDESVLESDESDPAEPCFFMSDTSRSGNNNGGLAEVRASAVRRGEHLCIALNDSAYVDRGPGPRARKAFRHTCNISGENTLFPEDGVVVSTMKYIPQLASLVAGFNFGSWQMFNLMSATTAAAHPNFPVPSLYGAFFGSPYDSKKPLPVTTFAFQEPENDPRNFCYLWVVQCENDFDTEQEKLNGGLATKSTIALFALTYENRDDGGDQYGVLYTGLTQCSKRFEHSLEGDPQTDNEVIGSVCLSCYTLENGHGKVGSNPFILGGSADAGEVEGSLSDSGIAVFLWQTYSSPDTSNQNTEEQRRKQPNYYFGIFDLNAWYQDRMPHAVQLERGIQCPYFSFCSLNEVLAVADEHDPENEQQLVNVCVDVSTVSRYHSMSKVEQHFYPSSLAFDMICLLERSTVHATHLGLQRKVLRELQIRGKLDLVEPDHLFQLFSLSGLIGVETCASISKANRREDQRSAILKVALEHHLVDFLTGCVRHWSDGKYADSRCTLKYILEWAWSNVVAIKQTIDKVTVPLFDWSCVELSESTKRHLMQNSQQLKHLSAILSDVMRHNRFGAEATTLGSIGMEEMKLKLSLTLLIDSYLEVVLWFFNAGLLPEGFQESPFRTEELEMFYNERRTEMEKKLAQFHFQDKVPCLVIDGLCKDIGNEMKINFEREGSKTGKYPPPSLRALLLSYLIHNEGYGDSADQVQSTGSPVLEEIQLRHRIVQYLFLDMASCLEDGKFTPLVDNLIKFPSAFSVPPSIIKLTQAFWLLDHGDFEDAVTILLDPLIKPKDILLWQHRSVLISLLVQDQPKLALKYVKIRQPPQKDLFDIQLQVAILLANEMVHEAFEHQRKRRSPQNSLDLLAYFFSKAQELNKLDSILQLPLLAPEERALFNFLKEDLNHGDSTSLSYNRHETLLMYLLQRSRFPEAISLNRMMEKKYRDPIFQEKNATRNSMMERYAHRLPGLGSNFTGGPRRAQKPKLFDQHFPPPLSLELRTAKGSSLPEGSMVSIEPRFHGGTQRERQEEQLSGERHRSLAVPFTPFRSKGARFKSYVGQQEGQWLPSTSVKRKLSEVATVVFATESDDEETGVTSSSASASKGNSMPAYKKSRLEASPSLLRKSTVGIRNIEATLEVLRTPIIEKKRQLRPSNHFEVDGNSFLEQAGSDSVPRGSYNSDAYGSATNPHSILKVKRAIDNLNSSSCDFNSFLLDVDHAPNDEEWLMNPKSRHSSSVAPRSRESTPGKTLRFNVPKRLPPADLDLSDDTVESQFSPSVHNHDNQRSIQSIEGTVEDSKYSDEVDKGATANATFVEVHSKTVQDKEATENEESQEFQILEERDSSSDSSDDEEQNEIEGASSEMENVSIDRHQPPTIVDPEINDTVPEKDSEAEDAENGKSSSGLATPLASSSTDKKTRSLSPPPMQRSYANISVFLKNAEDSQSDGESELEILKLAEKRIERIVEKAQQDKNSGSVARSKTMGKDLQQFAADSAANVTVFRSSEDIDSELEEGPDVTFVKSLAAKTVSTSSLKSHNAKSEEEVSKTKHKTGYLQDFEADSAANVTVFQTAEDLDGEIKEGPDKTFVKSLAAKAVSTSNLKSHYDLPKAKGLGSHSPNHGPGFANVPSEDSLSTPLSSGPRRVLRCQDTPDLEVTFNPNNTALLGFIKDRARQEIMKQGKVSFAFGLPPRISAAEPSEPCKLDTEIFQFSNPSTPVIVPTTNSTYKAKSTDEGVKEQDKRNASEEEDGNMLTDPKFMFSPPPNASLVEDEGTALSDGNHGFEARLIPQPKFDFEPVAQVATPDGRSLHVEHHEDRLMGRKTPDRSFVTDLHADLEGAEEKPDYDIQGPCDGERDSQEQVERLERDADVASEEKPPRDQAESVEKLKTNQECSAVKIASLGVSVLHGDDDEEGAVPVELSGSSESGVNSREPEISGKKLAAEKEKPCKQTGEIPATGEFFGKRTEQGAVTEKVAPTMEEESSSSTAGKSEKLDLSGETDTVISERVSSDGVGHEEHPSGVRPPKDNDDDVDQKADEGEGDSVEPADTNEAEIIERTDRGKMVTSIEISSSSEGKGVMVTGPDMKPTGMTTLPEESAAKDEALTPGRRASRRGRSTDERVELQTDEKPQRRTSRRGGSDPFAIMDVDEALASSVETAIMPGQVSSTAGSDLAGDVAEQPEGAAESKQAVNQRAFSDDEDDLEKPEPQRPETETELPAPVPPKRRSSNSSVASARQTPVRRSRRLSTASSVQSGGLSSDEERHQFSDDDISEDGRRGKSVGNPIKVKDSFPGKATSAATPSSRRSKRLLSSSSALSIDDEEDDVGGEEQRTTPEAPRVIMTRARSTSPSSQARTPAGRKSTPMREIARASRSRRSLTPRRSPPELSAQSSTTPSARRTRHTSGSSAGTVDVLDAVEEMEEEAQSPGHDGDSDDSTIATRSAAKRRVSAKKSRKSVLEPSILAVINEDDNLEPEKPGDKKPVVDGVGSGTEAPPTRRRRSMSGSSASAPVLERIGVDLASPPVTRSKSHSAVADSNQKSKKPLKSLKNPFSPQLSEEEVKSLEALKKAEADPAKKVRYSAKRSARSKKI